MQHRYAYDRKFKPPIMMLAIQVLKKTIQSLGVENKTLKINKNQSGWVASKAQSWHGHAP